ncbi:MAG TPA: prepilin-type N-terminal cleavage/methylation domain-containing protein [Candidatus Sulfotelmatobacter sp.]|nr:prepilin-type N-terminal cleavage/methylation domain-containing protein [Candidatus Sulfotelmatobacter sp.]
MNPAPSQAGFSLIEVILAVLILGIALVGLTEGVTSALTSSKTSETQTTAAMLAAGQIETLRAEGIYEDGETEGDFGDEFPQYHWTQTIAAESDISGLHDVDVTVEDNRTGKTLYDLRTMLFELPQGTNDVSHSRRPGHRREQ